MLRLPLRRRPRSRHCLFAMWQVPILFGKRGTITGHFDSCFCFCTFQMGNERFLNHIRHREGGSVQQSCHCQYDDDASFPLGMQKDLVGMRAFSYRHVSSSTIAVCTNSNNAGKTNDCLPCHRISTKFVLIARQLVHTRPLYVAGRYYS